MVDAESTDLVRMDQHLRKHRNFLGQARQLPCFKNKHFSVSTFQRIEISYLPTESGKDLAIFEALFDCGSLDSKTYFTR